MSIGTQARFESFIQTEKKLRKQLILYVVGEGEYTAREIALRLGFRDMNAVRPRITELVKSGKLIEAYATKDARTGRKVTVYAKAPAQLQL